MYHSFWHKVPFVRFFIPFVLGISTSIFFPCNFYFSLYAAGISLFSFLIAYLFLKRFRYAVINGICITSIFYFSGITLNLSQDELFHKDHFSYQQPVKAWIIRIDEPSVEKIKSVKFHAKVIGYIDSTQEEHHCSGNLMIYASKDTATDHLSYGDILLINPRTVRDIPSPKNPDEFDYKRYLRFHNIHYQAYLKYGQYSTTGLSQANFLFAWAYSVQRYFKQTLVTYISSASEAGVAQALLYGYDDEIDPETVQAYSNTGTLHVLAVSGMHVGLIFMIMELLLKFMNRSKRLTLVKHLVVIISLWIYSLLCGLSPSILRATVMFSFIILGKMVNRSTNIYNTLAISAFCLLCVDTNMIANVGFQLSYMAVIGIVFLQPYIYNWYDAKSWLGDQIWQITAVSIAAQVMTFPLGLLYFHQFPNYFLFSNLIVIPLSTLIIYVGILLLLFSKIPVIALFLGKCMYWGIILTNTIVKYVEQLPFSYVNGIHVSIAQTLIIFGILSCFISYFLLRRSALLLYWLVFSCLFCALQFLHFQETHQQRSIITYSIPSHTAIGIFSGTQGAFIIDSSLWNNKSAFRFHIQQHIWHHGITHQQVSFTDSLWKEFSFHDQSFLLTGTGNPDPESLKSHYAILFICHHVPTSILNQLKPKEVILSSALSAKAARLMMEVFLKRNIPVHFVGDSSAFELSL